MKLTEKLSFKLNIHVRIKQKFLSAVEGPCCRCAPLLLCVFLLHFLAFISLCQDFFPSGGKDTDDFQSLISHVTHMKQSCHIMRSCMHEDQHLKAAEQTLKKTEDLQQTTNNCNHLSRLYCNAEALKKRAVRENLQLIIYSENSGGRTEEQRYFTPSSIREARSKCNQEDLWDKRSTRNLVRLITETVQPFELKAGCTFFI